MKPSSRLTSAATGTLLERATTVGAGTSFSHCAFERNHFHFLTRCGGYGNCATGANPDMLTLNQVAYRWPDAAADCLHAISLELRDGEWLALTGDNGGKINAVTDYGRPAFPTSGSVTLVESRLRSLKSSNAAAIGVLFQEAENQIFPQQCRTRGRFWAETTATSAEEISRRTQVRCGYAN